MYEIEDDCVIFSEIPPSKKELDNLHLPNVFYECDSQELDENLKNVILNI